MHEHFARDGSDIECPEQPGVHLRGHLQAAETLLPSNSHGQGFSGTHLALSESSRIWIVRDGAAAEPLRMSTSSIFSQKGFAMNVLVAYATRHGATAEIAERIAARLQAAGLPAEARSVSEVNDVGPYDAVVIGGAAYMFHWLKEATAFAKRHQKELSRRPLWLFSSGPLGTDVVDRDGQDVVKASQPKEFEELQTLLRPRDERIFFGAWDPVAPPVGMGERLLRLMPASKEALPAGDFRDWPAVDAWADEIAVELNLGEAP